MVIINENSKRIRTHGINRLVKASQEYLFNFLKSVLAHAKIPIDRRFSD